MKVDPKRSRERMVREQIEARGVSDPLVLKAMRTVPRHLFVEEALAAQAYRDSPLPIGHGQTISQPYIVARMSGLLEAKPGMRVLEIGLGSGYQCAVLAEMGLEVYSIERVREVFLATRERLFDMGYYSLKLEQGDGTLGWPEAAPFDRILVTAGGPSIPEPLVEQLADPGILVIPVGASHRQQELILVRKEGGKVTRENKGGVAFVDLVGAYGW